MAPLVAALLVSTMLLACAGGGSSDEKKPRRYKIDHEYELVPGKAHHPGIERALILPLNAAVTPIQGLDVANDDLLRIIEGFLSARGVESTTLHPREYSRASSEAVRELRKKMMSGESSRVSGSMKLDDLMPLILEEIGAEAEIYVLPNVVVRRAEYTGGRTLKWDGVRRRERAIGLTMSGTTRAGSMLTMIFDASGKRVFSGYGGLDAVFQIDRKNAQYVVRDDLFEDLENLEEGVCISFHPYWNTVDC